MTRFLGVAVDPIEGGTLLNSQMTGGRIARTAGVSLVFAQSAVPASVTGTTSETVLATIPIPAGAMGANGVLRIRPKFSYNGNTNLKTLRVRLGGVSLWFGDNGGNASNIGALPFVDIHNRGATNVQIGIPGSVAGVNYQLATPYITATVDMTTVQNLTLTGMLANAADTITLEAYTAEILNP